MALYKPPDKMHTWHTRIVEVTIVDHKATGNALRILREGQRISLREMSRRLGKSAAFISDLERGNRNWTKETHDEYLRQLFFSTVIGKSGKEIE